MLYAWRHHKVAPAEASLLGIKPGAAKRLEGRGIETAEVNVLTHPNTNALDNFLPHLGELGEHH